ncbi:MAG: hypothetical protein OXM02_07025 [Bacteroidota bacterium]|nr:hypothetical protein [Bacteroidota bacterium]
MNYQSDPKTERAKLFQHALFESLEKSLKAHETQQSRLEGSVKIKEKDLKSIQCRMEYLAHAYKPDEPDLEVVSVFTRLQAADRHVRSTPAASKDTDDDWVFCSGHLAPYLDGWGVQADEAPLLQLLPSRLTDELKENFARYHLAAPWTKWDYGAVAVAVLVASLSDYFLNVAPPGSFRGERRSRTAISSWLKAQASPLAHHHSLSPIPQNAFQQWVQKVHLLARHWSPTAFDVLDPNEALTDNLRAALRLTSDPVLSLVVSLVDVASGRFVFRTWNGTWTEINRLPGQTSTLNIPEAILKLILYGLADVLAPKGLPVVYNGLPHLLGFASSPEEYPDPGSMPLKDVTAHMTDYGYRLVDFTRQPFHSAIVELLLAAYHAAQAIRGIGSTGGNAEYEWLKREQMRQLALTMMSSASVVGSGLYGWNPLNPNPDDFAALSTRMMTVMGSVNERNKKVNKGLIQGWKDVETDLFF